MVTATEARSTILSGLVHSSPSFVASCYYSNGIVKTRFDVTLISCLCLCFKYKELARCTFPVTSFASKTYRLNGLS